MLEQTIIKLRDFDLVTDIPDKSSLLQMSKWELRSLRYLQSIGVSFVVERQRAYGDVVILPYKYNNIFIRDIMDEIWESFRELYTDDEWESSPDFEWDDNIYANIISKYFHIDHQIDSYENVYYAISDTYFILPSLIDNNDYQDPVTNLINALSA